jgi:hypothetical protein
MAFLIPIIFLYIVEVVAAELAKSKRVIPNDDGSVHLG